LQFQAEQRTVENEDGDLVPADFPELPVQPARPQGDNVSNTELQYYREDTKKFMDVHVNIAILRNELIETALGPVIVAELEGLPGGLAEQSLGDILDYLERMYSEPAEDELVALELSCSEPFSSLGGLRAEVPKLRKKFDLLATYDQALSQLAKMTHFQNATQLFPAVVEAIKDYKKSVPNMSDRSFDGMTAFVIKQVPQLTVANLGWVGNASAASPTMSALAAELLPAILQHMTTTANAAGAAQQTGAHAGRGHGGGRVGGRNAAGRDGGRGRGGRGSAPLYCFEHGYKGHWGKDCTVMKADASYTEAMMLATAPCTIDGWVGSTAVHK
jgi:hypothetical protein